MAIVENTQFGRVGAFRFWCQKVLPAVYDDSLSYYELLCKVMKWLTDLTDVTNEQSDAITELQETLAQFMEGDFDSYIEEKVDEWFQQNQPAIETQIQILQQIVNVKQYKPLGIIQYVSTDANKAWFLVRINRDDFDIDVINNNGTYTSNAALNDVFEYMNNYGCQDGKSIAFNCDYFPSKMVLNGNVIGSADAPNVYNYLAINTDTGALEMFAAGTTFTDITALGYNTIFGASYTFRQNGVNVSPVPLNGYFAPRNVIGWDDDFIWFLIAHGRNYSAMGLDGGEIMGIFSTYTTAENILNLDGGGSVQAIMNLDGKPFAITRYTDRGNIREVPLNINFKYKEN